MPVKPFPSGFHPENIKVDGATIYVRVGGQGPAIVLLHGFGDTGDMWAPVAAALVGQHKVIVPDLRGIGLSSHPEGGYEKKTQARDIAQVMDALKVNRADLVTHDIGNMVGYALAAQFPERATKWVVIDAPLPGIGPWDEIIKSPMLWHFNFRGPDVERLVAGRERIYLDRFWNELSFKPKAIDEATRDHYAELYALPGARHLRPSTSCGIQSARRGRQPSHIAREVGSSHASAALARRSCEVVSYARDGRDHRELSRIDVDHRRDQMDSPWRHSGHGLSSPVRGTTIGDRERSSTKS